MKKLISPLWFILLAVLLSSCGNVRKAELHSGNDPQKAIAEVSKFRNAAQQDQVDVLANDLFSQGSDYLAAAKRNFQAGSSGESVIDKAAIAKALFEDARELAKSRESGATRILVSRASALEAGVRKSNDLVRRLDDIDDDLRGETRQFSRTLKPEDFSAFQKKYLALETKAVQHRELGGAKQAIARYSDKNADDLAPKSLRAAELDYETAMNTILQSPRSPSLYKKDVDHALASARLLTDVMDVILAAKGTPEHIALQIVKQNRVLVKQKQALGELTTSVGKLEDNLKTTKQTLEEKEGKLKQTEEVLKTQEEQLQRASVQVRFQQAMDQARVEISPDDALVYQQGANLVFRLKRINFETGLSVIPESSKPLLDNVNAIIGKLDAELVVVEGHTDSVGSTELNEQLSTARAEAVASYLSSLQVGYSLDFVGYGESQPIASNETAFGRATNRRVDLVVSVKQ